MGPHIEAVKTTINHIVDKLKEVFNDFGIRLAFIGYRDYRVGQETNKKFESERLIELKFGDNIEQFKSFVSDVKAYGGGDICEDVFGGN